MSTLVTLLAVALLVASPLTQPTLTVDFAVSAEEQRAEAAAVNNRFDMAKKLAHGEAASEEAAPLDCVERVVARMLDFARDNDFRSAGEQVIEKIKQKMEELDQKVKLLNASITQQILELQKAQLDIFKNKSYMSDSSHFCDQDEKIDESFMNTFTRILEREIQTLTKISEEYFNDKNGGGLNFRKKEDQLVTWEDKVNFYTSDEDLYPSFYQLGNIMMTRAFIDGLRRIRQNIRDNIKHKQDSSFWFIRWWWNSNAKLAESLLNTIDAAIVPIDKLKELDEQTNVLRDEYRLFVDGTNTDLPENLLNKFQEFRIALADDVKNIKEVKDKISSKYERDSTNLEYVGGWLIGKFGNFATELDDSLNNNKVHWLTLSKKIAELANPVFFDSSYFDSYNPKILLSSIVVQINGDEGKYSKQLTFADQECNIYSSYYNPRDKDTVAHRLVVLSNRTLEYSNSSLPFPRKKVLDTNWDSKYEVKVSRDFVEYVSKLAEQGKVFESMRCSLHLLGEHDTRLAITLDQKGGHNFYIQRGEPSDRLLLLV